jgi:hypothetical protein
MPGMEPSYTEMEQRHLQQKQPPGAEVEHHGLHSCSGSGSVTVPNIPGELQ